MCSRCWPVSYACRTKLIETSCGTGCMQAENNLLTYPSTQEYFKSYSVIFNPFVNLLFSVRVLALQFRALFHAMFLLVLRCTKISWQVIRAYAQHISGQYLTVVNHRFEI